MFIPPVFALTGAITTCEGALFTRKSAAGAQYVIFSTCPARRSFEGRAYLKLAYLQEPLLLPITQSGVTVLSLCFGLQ